MAKTIISCPQCGHPFATYQPEKRKYCSNACRLTAGVSQDTRQKMREVVRPHGPTNPSWRGGRKRCEGGYICVKAPDHPCRRTNNTVLEHRLVMEKMLGRLLMPNEVAHHVNGVKDDNRPENLELFQTHSAHRKHHGPLCVNPLNSETQRQCSECRSVKPLTHEFFPIDKHAKYGFDYRCRNCSKARWARHG